MKRLLLVLAACGGNNYTNAVNTPRLTLSEVHAPHLSVVVQTSAGLKRVWLDTGKSQDVSSDPDATAIDGSTILSKQAGQYVIERAGARTVVDGVAASYSLLSPDHKLIAVAEDGSIVTIAVVDAAVRRYPIGAQGTVGFQWAQTSDAVLVHYDFTTFRLELTSGAQVRVDDHEYQQGLLADSSRPAACPSGGFVLEKRTAKHEQQIVLIPTASTKDPETLASFDTRVLVRATDKSGHSGDGAINLGKKEPEALRLEVVLPSCEHFLFELEGKLYIGEVATGRIAYVTNGWGPVL